MFRPAFACRVLGWLLLVGAWYVLGMGSARADDWKPVPIPETWKKPPAGIDNLSWYRGFAQVPEAWRGRDLELFVEPGDWAHEVFVNGQQVGSVGAFPPFYRSGLAGADRFLVPAALVRFDRPNVVALRICNNAGRTGFNVAAPVLFGGEQAIRLSGAWQFRAGDDLAWSRYDAAEAPQGATLAGKLEPAADVARSLKKLADEIGPLEPAEAERHFRTPEDLEIKLAVGEPDVRQPLSLKWDERGRLWVVEYIQYPDPAGLKMLSRDKFLRSVYDKVPPPPPHHFPGADRISIHEDTDGDGRYDRHRVFLEGLSLASSIALGRGGVFVLNPPYLLFYADRNRDDVPDGDPEVLLEGFGIEDSHSVANSLRWGPDGWLYAAQGSTVTGDVRRYGTKDKPVHSLGQNIWRYHPELRRYEIFAEGGGNTFGVEIDPEGRVFSGTNGGNTRGYHYVQGAYYRKGFEKHGELSNPYAFGYFDSIPHHDVPRFTHTYLLYHGGALPEAYGGQLFGVGPLQSHVMRSAIEPRGSSFQTRDLDTPVATDDTWFRPVDIQVGPDGAIYIADFYEQRIDHASHYQGRIDRERGRVWRLSARGAAGSPRFDLHTLPADELVALLDHPNQWFRQTALRVVAERPADEMLPRLARRLERPEHPGLLEALWGTYQLGGLDESRLLTALDHADPFVRLWAVRLATDRGDCSPAVAAKLAELAARETNVEVRVQLACSARRMAAPGAMAIVHALLVRDEDSQDPYQPLLLWWAIETHADAGRDEVLRLLGDSALWSRPLVRSTILERLTRRYAAAGTRRDLLACAALLDLAPDAGSRQTLLAGFEKAFEGRALTGLPDELTAALARAGGGSLSLRLRTRDPRAIDEALARIGDASASLAERQNLVQIVGEIALGQAVPRLLAMVRGTEPPPLRAAALDALLAFDDPAIGETIVAAYSALPEDLRPAALALLASRKGWAVKLVEAIDAGTIPAAAVSEETVRRLLFHRDERLAALVKKHFGEIQGATSAELYAQVELLQKALAEATGNPYEGKRLFLTHCGKCHVLFGEGGRIGPDLTSYKRDDLHTMLLNIVNPSAQIREGFENYLVITSDGRALTGFITEQDARVVVLRGVDGQTFVLPRSEIDDLAAQPRSLMPEGILKPLTPVQVRDLFAYLRATQPLQAP